MRPLPSVHDDPPRSIPRALYAAIACVLVVAVAVIARNIPGTGRSSIKETAPEQVEPKASGPREADFELSAQAFDAIPAKEGLQPFSLSDREVPEFDPKELTAVTDVLAAIEGSGEASVVFVDAQTGRGLAYQPDCAVYGASSFKALYALYVCEELVERGAVSLDDLCTVGYALDPSGYDGGSYPVSSLIEAAVVDSSNNAYGALRDAFDMCGFDEWVTALGAGDARYRADSWFPTYCARSSARLWAELLSYMRSDSETARWLGDITLQTSTSFIRDGLDGTGSVVRDKAGWCTDQDPDYNGVSDAGIVQVDGATYIMSIMTGMPDSEANRALVGDLARALMECRDALGVGDADDV